MIGSTVSSRFRIERVLGEGSMGCVYDAVDVTLERRVAIKVLHSHLCSNEQFLERFWREAKTIAQLSSNPHIITIYDIGQTDQSQPFLVTEYLTGKTLGDEMDQPHLASRSWVLDVSLQVLSALIDSHSKGVIHRDLKPANIFVMSTKTIPLHVKVLDFGLSRSDASSMSPELATQPGVPIGTPKYIAPEVLAGDRAQPPADIYAFGLVLYELATGKYPFTVESAADCLRAHLTETPSPFPQARVPFPTPFEPFVFQMLAKRPSDRPTAVECYRSISRINTEIDLAKLGTKQDHLTKP